MSELPKIKLQPKHGDSQTVTVLAPTPQDAKYCDQVLREHGVPVEIVTSVYEVTSRIREGAGVVLIAQEFLTSEATARLRQAVNEQPSWSDVPILVLLAQRETPPRVITELLTIGHVTLIERPLRIALLVSTLQAKLRDRARQYEVRDLLLKAQLANASKSEFLANMSHEIRTPMTSILGYAELMTGLIENEEALGYLATIRRNGDFLLGIINDILDLSKIEAGKFDIDIERFDPARVIEDVRRIMEVRASEKGLKLDVKFAGAIPQFIESDAKRLKQILINLVGNAIKFTKSGSVKITVEFERNAVTGDDSANPVTDQLRIGISDSGIGMTPVQRERLFKPFSQGDSLITQQFGGTGLGLAISQRLAAMLGGEIRVDSKINKGSTFTLTIATGKLSDTSLIEPRGRQESEKVNEPAESIELDVHVLIVDDRRDIRFLSKHIVTNAGGRVTEAEDGVLAIETVKQATANGIFFDLILLDMQMPNMDGYETARHLRQLGYAGPIIALTADAMQGDMNKCLEAGCNDYLSKPIDKLRMLEKVAALVKTSEER
ncbi:response regulator [Aporhodopirellula aestuarii]|uniref:histidine kinase n=1 Tax=Aporhodopirellula aestuarii TaxID=2950107 RepID=A0ABT0UBB2_9BACT|nr:response regulator [Aporhodopirellula aestuarii]MCM2374299.1 ATP-binding protein [Aporhodopirellula aestuarii]